MHFNVYAIIILAALLLESVLNFIGDRLNLTSAAGELPSEFKDVYDPQKYAESQQYLRVTTRFVQIKSLVSLGILLIFWFAGGFYFLDQMIAQILPSGWPAQEVVAGLIYAGVLLAAKSIIDLPFRVYETFSIEQRFGFNRTTPGTFVLDMVKVVFLAVLLGGPLFAALLAFFQYAGDAAWLYCWAVATVFVFVVQFVAPRWIMPLFNKFSPLEDGELRRAVEAYAQKIGFPLQGIYVMDGSKRSTKSNAFFTGFGKNRRIALFDTLIADHTVSELLTVLAHEIGHFRKKHILKSMLLGILHTGVLFFLLSIFLDNTGLYTAFGFPAEETPIYAGFVFFSLLYSPVELMLSVLINAYMRKNEREADQFAVETTEQRSAFASALKKLSRNNLVNLTPHPFYVTLHYSHPPVLERIRHIL